jgi:hypothetical protein
MHGSFQLIFFLMYQKILNVLKNTWQMTIGHSKKNGGKKN